MQKIFLVLFVFVAVVFGQTWVQRATVKHHTEFFLDVMQETVYELERRGWSSLKLTDIHQTINAQMYSLLVNGTVLYTNGFLVSVQKLDVTTINEQVSTPTVNGVATPTATVSGNLFMRQPRLGYDVIVDLVDTGIHRSTGDVTLPDVTWSFTIVKNLISEEISVSLGLNTGGGTIRMVHRPPSHVAEVVSRNFFAYTPYDGINTWRTVMQSIALDIVRNKIPFPEICYDC